MSEKAIDAAAFDKAMTLAACCSPQDCASVPWKCGYCIETQRNFLSVYEAALWQPIESANDGATESRQTKVLFYSPILGSRSGTLFQDAQGIIGAIPTLHGDAITDWGVTKFRPLPSPPESEQ